MSAPFLRMEVHAAGPDRFKVVSKIEGAARLERTVLGASLPLYVQSVLEVAQETEARHHPHRLVVESPDKAVSRG